MGHSSEVSLKVTEKDTKNLNASIVSPTGLEEPCFLKTLPNGHLGKSCFSCLYRIYNLVKTYFNWVDKSYILNLITH